MSPWQKLLERPHAGGHFAQLYAGDDGALVKNAGRYFWKGLRCGEGVLVIASPERHEPFARHLRTLGADIEQLLASGQLLFLDAHQTLAAFMTFGQPDWVRFEHVIHGAMRRVQLREDVHSARAYGEMVGILWQSRQYAAAIRLEQYWNRLLEQSQFSLFCAYSIDILGQDFAVSNLDAVLCTHTHLIPSESDGELETALNRAMDEVLGAEAGELRMLIRAKPNPSWAVMPAAENIILWLRKYLPARSQDIMTRARQHYVAQRDAAVAGEASLSL